LENLDDEMDTNINWETIREKIKISAKVGLDYYELKQQKPWIHEEPSKLLDKRIQVKLQWLQDPTQINGNNLNHVIRGASRHFRNKTMEYPKDKLNKVTTHSKNSNITDLYRGIMNLSRVTSLELT
jgi:hypothetical protein